MIMSEDTEAQSSRQTGRARGFSLHQPGQADSLLVELPKASLILGDTFHELSPNHAIPNVNTILTKTQQPEVQYGQNVPSLTARQSQCSSTLIYFE